MRVLKEIEVQEVNGGSLWKAVRWALKHYARTGGAAGPNRYTGEWMG